MTDSYLKAVTALAAVLLTVGFTSGQPVNPGGEQAPDDVGPENSEEIPGEANQSQSQMRALGNLPDLPSRAADQAVTAVANVEDFLTGGINDLGNALGGLLGNSNETESEPENDSGTEGISL